HRRFWAGSGTSASLGPLQQRDQRQAPGRAPDGVEQKVDPRRGGQQPPKRDQTPDPEHQEDQHADSGHETAGAGRHQRLFRNRKKAPRQTTAPIIDHRTHGQESSVLTAKTRTARKQSQATPTPATSSVANRPRRPVRRSATHAS